MERSVRGGSGADEFLSLTCSHALFIQSCDVGAGLYEISISDHRFGLLVQMKKAHCPFTSGAYTQPMYEPEELSVQVPEQDKRGRRRSQATFQFIG